MKVTIADAYAFLKLPYGASLGEVETQYQILAYRYHISNSLKKLQQVTCAYKRIVTPNCSDYFDMDMEAMKDIFKNIFGSARNGYEDGDDSYSGSDYSDDEFTSIRHSEQQSEQIAQELISEEEKEKRKAEKRRAKKKKRREKKKLEKEQEMHAAANAAEDGRNETPNGIRSSDEGEGIDPNAAFVKKSNKKKSETAPASAKIDNNSPSQHVADKQNDTTDPSENSTSNTKKSRLIANKGNEAAHSGDYPAAIHQFSEAIKLEPSDYRFYGNRSYCYDRIMQFDKALTDADKCIVLNPEWAKGYFRKGRALAGLKLFSDAEKAFTQVLKLDKTCEEASKELSRVRTQQLIDMGFSAAVAEKAVFNKNSLQQALESLLSSAHTEVTFSSDDVYISDPEEEQALAATASSAQKIQNSVNTKPVSHQFNPATEEKKMDPTNPEGLTALWVGNVLPSVHEDDLQNLFNRYGHVSSVRCLPEKYCAFVNFKSKEAAGKAMNALQNHEVSGQKLLIKFPDNPIAQAQAKHAKQPLSVPAVNKDRKDRPPTSQAVKASGPVNGDECYYWRTTGCQFGNKCRHRHVPESKGIDRKPWHRVK